MQNKCKPGEIWAYSDNSIKMKLWLILKVDQSDVFGDVFGFCLSKTIDHSLIGRLTINYLDDPTICWKKLSK